MISVKYKVLTIYMAKVVHSSDFDKINWIFKKRFHKKKEGNDLDIVALFINAS